MYNIYVHNDVYVYPSRSNPFFTALQLPAIYPLPGMPKQYTPRSQRTNGPLW